MGQMRGAGEGRDRELVGADAMMLSRGVVAVAGLGKVGDFARENQGLPDSVLGDSGIRK
jgi:hypothetical protein